MQNETDKVNVSFVYRGKTYETATCERRSAEAVGKAMVKTYSEIFMGSYVIEEIDNSPASITAISGYKRKPKVTVSAKRPVPHHYEIIV
jgi:hypothetical protein